MNNLNDGLAWGLFRVLFVSSGLNLNQVGILAAAYPRSGAPPSFSPGQPQTGGAANGSSWQA